VRPLPADVREREPHQHWVRLTSGHSRCRQSTREITERGMADLALEVFADQLHEFLRPLLISVLAEGALLACMGNREPLVLMI
jgi:hypothetical protein